jgi:ABC-type multidrug transport system fused ATPase/permease subunit
MPGVSEQNGKNPKQDVKVPDSGKERWWNREVSWLKPIESYNPLRLPPLAVGTETSKQKTEAVESSSQPKTSPATGSQKVVDQSLPGMLSTLRQLFSVALEVAKVPTLFNLGIGLVGSLGGVVSGWVVSSVQRTSIPSISTVVTCTSVLAAVAVFNCLTGFASSAINIVKGWRVSNFFDEKFGRSVLGREFNQLEDASLHKNNQELSRNRYSAIDLLMSVSSGMGSAVGLVVSAGAFCAYSPYFAGMIVSGVLLRLAVDFRLSPSINAHEMSMQDTWAEIQNYNDNLADPKLAREMIQHDAKGPYLDNVKKLRKEAQEVRTAAFRAKIWRQVFGSSPIVLGGVITTVLPVMDFFGGTLPASSLPSTIGAGAGLISSALMVSGFWGNALSNRVLIQRVLDFVRKYGEETTPSTGAEKKHPNNSVRAQPNETLSSDPHAALVLPAIPAEALPKSVMDGTNVETARRSPVVQRFSSIEFKNAIARTGSDGAPILTISSLSLRNGEFVGVVGPQGGGKTTLFRLLMKQIDPGDPNSIVIKDYIDPQGKRHERKRLADIETAEWHKVVTSMYQDYPDMNGLTIEQVTTLGKTDINREVFDKIASLVKYKEEILRGASPEKVRLGSKLAGKDLSGGQRQALALLRAASGIDNHLLLLDEPGAKSDPATERKMIEGLQELASEMGLSLIVVSHRYGTILRADKILVISDGKIEAEGTHASLLRESATYREGWVIQVESLVPGLRVVFDKDRNYTFEFEQ